MTIEFEMSSNRRNCGLDVFVEYDEPGTPEFLVAITLPTDQFLLRVEDLIRNKLLQVCRKLQQEN